MCKNTLQTEFTKKYVGFFVGLLVFLEKITIIKQGAYMINSIAPISYEISH